nr:hypothetical protein [Tanacetum cinerariifolium]
NSRANSRAKDEEEHPASADSVPTPVHCVTASMFFRAQTSISLPSEIKIAKLLAIPTPPPLPLSLLVDVLEVTLPPWKRLCIALGPRFEVGKSLSTPTARPTGGFRADYGFVGTLDDEIK